MSEVDLDLLVWPAFIELGHSMGLKVNKESDFYHPFQAAVGEFRGVIFPGKQQTSAKRFLRVLLLWFHFPYQNQDDNQSLKYRHWMNWFDFVMLEMKSNGMAIKK